MNVKYAGKLFVDCSKFYYMYTKVTTVCIFKFWFTAKPFSKFHIWKCTSRNCTTAQIHWDKIHWKLHLRFISVLIAPKYSKPHQNCSDIKRVFMKDKNHLNVIFAAKTFLPRSIWKFILRRFMMAKKIMFVQFATRNMVMLAASTNTIKSFMKEKRNIVPTISSVKYAICHTKLIQTLRYISTEFMKKSKTSNAICALWNSVKIGWDIFFLKKRYDKF